MHYKPSRTLKSTTLNIAERSLTNSLTASRPPKKP